MCLSLAVLSLGGGVVSGLFVGGWVGGVWRRKRGSGGRGEEGEAEGGGGVGGEIEGGGGRDLEEGEVGG